MTDVVSDAAGLLTPGVDATNGFQPDFSNLERLVDGLFDEIERLSSELDAKVSELGQQRELMESREREMAQQREDLSQLSGQWKEQQALMVEVQTEVRDLKTQMGRQLEQLAQAAALSENAAARFESEAAVVSAEWAEKIAATQRERDQLENELIRFGRAMLKLTERISQQQRQLEQGQGETATELKRLGALVEERFGRIAQMAPPGNQPAAANAATLPSQLQENVNPDDPVVNSVVAQLARLQRDMSRRPADDRPAT